MKHNTIKIRRHLLHCAVGLFIWLVGAYVRAADQSALSDLSFEELSHIQIAIASVADKPVREQPAIVSVITEQQIKETGARDLMGVLSLVPGFSFQEDTSTTLGAGFRGFWANEGKMLVLLDGIPVNDGLWGTVQLDNHYAAAQIKQVEIIRGPGSARYGGNAEVAVVKITTKGAEQNGGFVSVRPEAVPGRIGASTSAGAGYSFAHDWRFSVGIDYGNFIRSDQNYVSESGKVVDMRRDSDMKPFLINGSLGWRDLELRFMYDNYEYKNPLGNGEPPTNYTSWSRTFRTWMGSAKYDLKPSDAVTISPTLTVLDQKPWWLRTSGQGNFELEYTKWDLDVPTVIAFNNDNHLLAGFAGYFENAEAVNTSHSGKPENTFFHGSDKVGYHDFAGYAQYDLDTSWANFSLGGRYEKHSYAGSAWVPRLSTTKAWDRFHVKLLYDEAFRTPNIDDIYYQGGTSPVIHEKTASYQLEAGYQFNQHLSTVANLYYMRITCPIVFTTVGTIDATINGGPVSNYGGEWELRFTGSRCSGFLGYSYYQADEQLPGSAPAYLYGSSVKNLNLGQPAHKVSASGTFHLTRKLDWNLNGAYYSATRAWAYPGTEQWLSHPFILNTFINYRWNDLDLGAGFQNLLDQNTQLGQAYNGGAAPLPLLGRTFFLRLASHF